MAEWQVGLIAAVASLFGVLVGGVLTLAGDWIKLVREDRRPWHSQIVTEALALQQALELAAARYTSIIVDDRVPPADYQLTVFYSSYKKHVDMLAMVGPRALAEAAHFAVTGTHNLQSAALDNRRENLKQYGQRMETLIKETRRALGIKSEDVVFFDYGQKENAS